MIVITVEQGVNDITFKFNREYIEQAFEFAEKCLETGNRGTVVEICDDGVCE